MRFSVLIISFLCICPFSFSQSGLLNKRISISFDNKNIAESIKQIAENDKINFIYSDNILENKKRITRKFENKSLRFILEEIIKNTDFRFTEYDDAILVFKEKQKDFFIIELNIIDIETGEGIAYAAMQKIGEFDAEIANNKGILSLRVDQNSRNEKLVFSSMTFLNDTLSMDSILKYGIENIYLTRKTFMISEVKVQSSFFKQREIGNDGNMSIGALYLDTHGQQMAYHLENKKKRQAKLKEVKVFISKKGNVEAPFRLRIYEIDKETQMPGTEILKEVLVYKPSESGWFSMNISAFEINLPENGLLIAIQGIYTNEFEKNEFEYSKTSYNEINSFENIPETVSYGQRIGYSKLNGNNTWHFSLNHSWYQLDKRNYHLMISAEILYEK